MTETLTGLEVAAPTYAEIAVPAPLRRLFTYSIPSELASTVKAGSRVAVSFHGRVVPGIVVRLIAEPPKDVRIKAISGLLEAEPVFEEELLAFLTEAADYYLHPLGEVLKSAAPALPSDALRALKKRGAIAEDTKVKGRSLATRKITIARAVAGAELPLRLGVKQRQLLDLLEARGPTRLDELRDHLPDARSIAKGLAGKGVVELEEREVVVDPFFAETATPDVPPALHEEQRVAVEALEGALATGKASTFLLQGVTGSGKTEVYLRVIEAARAAGRGALLLVPEIALTPQLVSRFRARFGDGIAVLHSGLTERERDDHWRALRHGVVSLAIGARSALFAPVSRLGVIVVDEEHDGSFKQEEGFRYNARDLAILRAHRAGALCILGSATPSIEMRQLAEDGRISRLVLSKRATSHPLPQVEIVDLKRHREGPSGHPLITAPLHRALEACLAQGGQAILFLNRRGFAPSLRCTSCGEAVECPSCSVALTEHRRANLLRCHYCDFAMPASNACPQCGSLTLERIGMGTEKLEELLADAFSPARVARLDRDTSGGGGTEEIIAKLRRREIDILVGTQMVTKGHDVPSVTLVGVVLADQSLAFPDFRASERTFQLLAQVAGRAGRGEVPGRVIFQTYLPDNPAVQLAAQHAYEEFFVGERADRKSLGYPPFARIVALRVDAADEGIARRTIDELARIARSQEPVAREQVRLLGPAEAPIARLRGRYRFRMMLVGEDRRAVRRVALALEARIQDGLGTARAFLDVDPVSML